MFQQKRFSSSFGTLQLKPISWAVLIAETMDLATTLAGFVFFPQMWEANPLPGILGGWSMTIFIKVTATVLVIATLEKVERWPRPVWVVPLAASLPVMWNLMSILAEVFVSFGI
jgi:hypothetical protein